MQVNRGVHVSTRTSRVIIAMCASRLSCAAGGRGLHVRRWLAVRWGRGEDLMSRGR